MKNSIQKSLFIVSVISVFSVLFITCAQAASFTKLMKIGIINPNSADKYVVIYNHDQSECLSTYGHNRSGTKNLSYAPCRMDDTDTWVITTTGKIKNKHSGKCLSSPKSQDNLVLIHCNFMYSRYKTAYDFIILDHLTDSDDETVEIADIRY